jgi:hypothetical protein
MDFGEDDLFFWFGHCVLRPDLRNVPVFCSAFANSGAGGYNWAEF